MSTGRLLALVAAAAMAFGCAARRGSAVASAGGGRAPVSGERPPTTANEQPERPLDTGPDLQPLREDVATGQEILGAEGGPLADIHFDYDQAALGDEARATLSRNAQWLQQHPEARVTIEGHCDERGTVEYNLALGDLRAQSVREYLASLGVAAERLTPVSYGKEKPLDPQASEAAFSRNRRAHFVVTR